jgi:hypothetical protein
VAIYEILITDVTRYGSKFCVAGWDLGRSKMIRPEPSGARAEYEASKFWDGELAGSGKIWSVGNVVRFEASKPVPDFGLPHATEDRVLADGSKLQVLKTLTLNDVAKAARASVASDIPEAFGGGLERQGNGKASVPAGFKGPSLGAVELKAEAIHLHENTWEGKTKLRANINDGSHSYDFSVPAEALGDRWRAVGLKKLQAEVQSCGRVHVRVGLARAWAQNPCYAQVNGLYLL